MLRLADVFGETVHAKMSGGPPDAGEPSVEGSDERMNLIGWESRVNDDE